MPDGKSLLIGANDTTRVALWVQPLDGAARRLDLGSASPASSFWVDVAVGRDGAIAFTATDPSRPAELYYMASATATPNGSPTSTPTSQRCRSERRKSSPGNPTTSRTTAR
jgi:hypothetical protein